MLEPVTQQEFMVHAYVSVVVAVFTTVTALLGFLQARAAAKHAAEANRVLTQVNIKLNGRLDELLKAQREAGHQHGRAEGIMEERTRREVGR